MRVLFEFKLIQISNGRHSQGIAFARLMISSLGLQNLGESLYRNGLAFYSFIIQFTV